MTAGEVRTRYFLDTGDGEVEVSKAAYVAAERAAGLVNRLGQPDEPAAHSFGQYKDGKVISGRLQDVDLLQDLVELRLRQGARLDIEAGAQKLHDLEGPDRTWNELEEIQRAVLRNWVREILDAARVPAYLRTGEDQ